jgi:hypothetical protein
LSFSACDDGWELLPAFCLLAITLIWAWETSSQSVTYEVKAQDVKEYYI